MKTVKQLQLSGLLVLLTLLSACQSKPKDGQTDTYTSGVIAIAADESFQPIVQEEIDVFEGLFPLAGIVPRYVTEVDAVNLLLKDSLRLAITSRRLTPEECERINGFEAGWTDTGTPERQRYFLMGNALVVPLIEKMGRKLLEIM